MPTPNHSGIQSESVQVVDIPASLARLGGDEDLLHRLIQIFLEDHPPLLRQAAESLEKQDAKTLERAAHSIKGLVANFSAAPAGEAALQLEEAARAGQFSLAAGHLPKLVQEVDRVAEALHTVLERKRP